MLKYQMHYRVAIPWYRMRVRSRHRADGVLVLRAHFEHRRHAAAEAWSYVPDFRAEPVTRKALDDALIGRLQLRSHLFDLFLFEASDPNASVEVHCYPNVAERQAELRALKVSDQILHLHDLIQQELGRAGIRGRLVRVDANQQVVRAILHGTYWKHAGRAIGFFLTMVASAAVLTSTGVLEGAHGRLATTAGGSVLSYFIGATLTAAGFWFRHFVTGKKREVEYHVVE